jgi:hypothetical protein
MILSAMSCTRAKPIVIEKPFLLQLIPRIDKLPLLLSSDQFQIPGMECTVFQKFDANKIEQEEIFSSR